MAAIQGPSLPKELNLFLQKSVNPLILKSVLKGSPKLGAKPARGQFALLLELRCREIEET